MPDDAVDQRRCEAARFGGYVLHRDCIGVWAAGRLNRMYTGRRPESAN